MKSVRPAGRRNCTRRSCLNGTVLELKRLLPPISKSTMCNPPPRTRSPRPTDYCNRLQQQWHALTRQRCTVAADRSLEQLENSLQVGILRGTAYEWSRARDGEVRRARTCHACVVLDHVVHACSMLRSSGLNK